MQIPKVFAAFQRIYTTQPDAGLQAFRLTCANKPRHSKIHWFDSHTVLVQVDQLTIAER